MGNAKSFSVLTVSKRKGWEQMASESMRKQTVSPRMWQIVTEDKYSSEWFKSYDSTWVSHCYAPYKHRLSNLSASLNEGLKQIRDSDYVIFYQDFIELPPDCFEKLLNLVNEKTFVTTCTPNYDGSDDGRYTGTDLPRPCRPDEWETNVAIAPLKFLKKLGGFDEEYDWGWAWDNVNIAERAAMLGAKFILDESNRPKLYPHEMTSHQTIPLNAKRHEDTMRAIREGKRPIKNKYL